jgi:hypothetical protein
MDNLNLNLSYEFSKKLHKMFEIKDKKLVLFETDYMISSNIVHFVVYKDLNDDNEDDGDFILCLTCGFYLKKEITLNKKDDMLAQIKYIKNTYRFYRYKGESFLLSPDEYQDAENSKKAKELVCKKIDDYLRKA